MSTEDELAALKSKAALKEAAIQARIDTELKALETGWSVLWSTYRGEVLCIAAVGFVAGAAALFALKLLL